MTTIYRLQFLDGTTAYGATVLAEKRVVAENVEAAMRYVAESEWPAGAVALRLVDLDGRQVFERTKIDRSSVG